jgi:hypothetical protein
MGRSKGITLHGAAAGAFIRAQSGDKADTADEQALRIATVVHMYMSGRAGDGSQTAIALIKQVAKEGLEATAKTCTVDKKPEG